MDVNCYSCRYWARYPNQPKQKKSDLVSPEYVRLMVQGGGYTDEQRKKVEEAIQKFKIMGFCTYWKEDKQHDDTCSGCHPINIDK